jgi:methyl-accepting chemotaxis protein
MLAKFPIRTKIIAVVAFLMVAMTGMGLLAVKNMRSINANTVDISTSWLPSVRILGDLRAGVITYRNVIREHMLAETLEEKLANEKTLATVVESNTKIRAAYEPLITSAEERAMYNEWVRLWESYKKGTEEVMALSRKAAGKIPTEAHELNTKTGNKIGLDADVILKKDIDLNNTGADKAAQDAADSYAAAFMMLAVILGAAVVAGIGVSYYLVRDVSTGIASIVTPMQALGNGDLSADVPHQGEKTEIGAMADTLQVFKRALIAKKAADEAAAADAEAGFRGSLRQCAVGGVGDRRAFLLCHRDQPPGAGIGADGNRCGRSGPRHQQPGQRIVQGGEPHRRRRRAHQHHRGAD